MQVRFHQVSHYLDVVKIGFGQGAGDVDQSDYVEVLEELEHLDFPNDAFGVHQVFERLRHFLDGYFGLRHIVECRNYDSLRA